MKKLFTLLVATVVMAAMGIRAEVFTTSPSPLQQSSQNVKILFNAEESGVAGLKTATELFAHIGVCIDGGSDWTHVKGSWSSNTDDKKFVKNAQGLWELNVGDINTYFGIQPGEVVTKICVIARNKAGTSQTKDFFLDVAPEGFAMSFTYNTENLVILKPTAITFTLSATADADLSISVDGNVIASATASKSISKEYNFNTEDKFYTVVATAKKGGETLSESVTVAYPKASAQANYPGGVPKQGAVKQSDGSVIFCLAAPQKSSVILVPSWDGFQNLKKNVMNYQDYNGYRYFWTRVTGLENNKYYSYYYLVDGATRVGDPYAKIMLDNYSDKWMPKGIWGPEEMPQYPYDKIDDTMLAVYRGDIDDYNWSDATKNFKTPNQHSMVVYEVLLRDFTGDGSDSDGKHFGTFRTAMPKIQYLKDLGVNVVELLPVMEFNGNSSWGYNTNGYMALDKIYGSPRQMRDFIDQCHQLGIAVVLDIVFNQSDGLHPWYQMYPVASNPFYNATAPHDWSVLNDFRQDYPLVEEHWKDVLRYWLEAYKVDGFRFDLVKGLGDNSSYGSTDAFNQSRVNRMKRLNDHIKSIKPDAIHINELLAEGREDNSNFANGGQKGWMNINYGSGQYAQGAASKLSDMKGFYGPNWSRTFGATIEYAESHDEPRIANKIKNYGHASVKYSSATPKATAIRRLGSVAAMMLVSPGAKMIWQFGELAADDNFGTELDKLRAIAPKWDDVNDPSRGALLQNYKELCHMRLDNPGMFDGSATYAYGGFIDNLDMGRYIRLTKGNQEIVAFFNPSVSKAVDVSVGVNQLNASNSHLISAAYGTTPTLTMNGNTAVVNLPAHSYAVFATKNIASIEGVAEDLADEANVRVYTDGSDIVIEGEYNTAEVYDLQGRLAGMNGLPAGVYIVRVDGTTTKVAIR